MDYLSSAGLRKRRRFISYAVRTLGRRVLSGLELMGRLAAGLVNPHDT